MYVPLVYKENSEISKDVSHCKLPVSSALPDDSARSTQEEAKRGEYEKKEEYTLLYCLVVCLVRGGAIEYAMHSKPKRQSRVSFLPLELFSERNRKICLCILWYEKFKYFDSLGFSRDIFIFPRRARSRERTRYSVARKEHTVSMT